MVEVVASVVVVVAAGVAVGMDARVTGSASKYYIIISSNLGLFSYIMSVVPLFSKT